MKYSMFIGRWQPWHDGHQWLIDQRLKEGKNILICIRDVLPDEKNPYTCEEVYDNIQQQLREFIDGGVIKVMIIPDIESVNYGRNVGYEIIEHFPPPEIKEISATKIRNEK
ncbi:adenylyltransferase/cytidyltransferase family protein, partial [Candidatus Woesearchaeota archaeon]|nr:adenylyltransferase/cytidyltransferase family protein [Candidatus Woesearchaeota archaeon]MBT7558009.1 adenylyltransferase/cytidyltransferase family protein [Candidatus Woesearchaeota archaeon]